jgi:hypothetical protein
MIEFTCPCGKSLRAQDEYAGQLTRCPSCGRDLPIPGEAGAVQTADVPRTRDYPPDNVRPGREAPPSDWNDRSPGSGRRGGRGAAGEYTDEPRERPPTTSGKAVTSLILGILSLFLCYALTGIPAIVLGALGLRDVGRGKGRVQGKGMALAGLITGVLGTLATTPLMLVLLLIPAVQSVREASARISSANNLKEMTLAMNSYSDANGQLPSVGPRDPRTGKSALSWRVALLPYIEQGNLYNQFNLDEPWDGPNNSRLIPLMPKTYALPGDTATQPGYTHYRVFVGGGAPFNNEFNSHIPASFPDGMTNTILIVEAGEAVPWTKPDELPYDPARPLPPLGGFFSRGYNVGMGDGSVHWVAKTVSEQTLRDAITANDGRFPGPDW